VLGTASQANPGPTQALDFPGAARQRFAEAMGAELVEVGEPIELTDPAPAALRVVCEEWGLAVEPTPGAVNRW